MRHLGNSLLRQIEDIVVVQSSTGEDVTMSCRCGGGESVQVGGGEVGDGDEDLSPSAERDQQREGEREEERGSLRA